MSVTPPPPLPPSGAPDPEPRPHAVPLNRSEEHTLAGLEADLRRSDPDLDTELSSLAAATDRDTAFRGMTDRVLQAVAIGAIVLVLLPREWLPVVFSFGLLLGVPFVMAVIAVRAHRAESSSPAPDSGVDGPGDGPAEGGDRLP